MARERAAKADEAADVEKGATDSEETAAADDKDATGDEDGARPGASDSATAEAAEATARRKPTRRRVLLALGVGLLAGGGGGFAGGYYTGKPRRRPRQKGPPLKPAFVPVAEWSPTKGPEAAKVTVVAFLDYQCPHCARVHRSLEQIQESHSGDVRLVLRHRPLSFHKRARAAAVAVQAARLQGKAWEMHGLLLDNRKELAREDLEEYAADLKLDVDKFKSDLDDPQLAQQVDEDNRFGQQIGARGTPTLFINGLGVRGAKPREFLEQIVEDEIKKADELLQGGTPLPDVYEKRAKAQPQPKAEK